jgi:hypothetical protein
MGLGPAQRGPGAEPWPFFLRQLQTITLKLYSKKNTLPPPVLRAVPYSHDGNIIEVRNPIDNDIRHNHGQFTCARLTARPPASGKQRQTVSGKQ